MRFSFRHMYHPPWVIILNPDRSDLGVCVRFLVLLELKSQVYACGTMEDFYILTWIFETTESHRLHDRFRRFVIFHWEEGARQMIQWKRRATRLVFLLNCCEGRGDSRDSGCPRNSRDQTWLQGNVDEVMVEKTEPRRSYSLEMNNVSLFVSDSQGELLLQYCWWLYTGGGGGRNLRSGETYRLFLYNLCLDIGDRQYSVGDASEPACSRWLGWDPAQDSRAIPFTWQDFELQTSDVWYSRVEIQKTP